MVPMVFSAFNHVGDKRPALVIKYKDFILQLIFDQYDNLYDNKLDWLSVRDATYLKM